MKFSDLDLDIPSSKSETIRSGLIKASILTEKGTHQNHPAGIYMYAAVPSFEGVAIVDYKEMEQLEYQKIDILNNTYLDDISNKEMIKFVGLIEYEDIDWKELWRYTEPYQLGKYPGILREFKVASVMDLAIILALIRPGSVANYDKMKAYIHTDTILNKKSEKAQKILKETYGIPIFNEQFKLLGIDDGKYRYKKPHSIGYAYVLLIDFLKNH